MHMNKVWLGAGVVVLLVVAFVLAGRYQSSPEPVTSGDETAPASQPRVVSSSPVEAVEAFFALLAAGNTGGAYRAQATAAQGEDTEAAFAAAAKKAGFTDYESAAWTEREATGAGAVVEGTLQLKGGRSLPVLVTLVNEGGGWKIRSIGAAQ